MNRSKVFIYLVIGAIAAMVSGCATAPGTTEADRMRDHRSDTEIRAQSESELRDRLAQEWERGQNLIESGSKQIADGEDLIESAETDFRRGQNLVERGQRELDEGTELVRTSERRFRNEFGETDLTRSR